MDYPQSLTDKNRGPGDVALAVVLTVISTIVIMLRVYSKLFVIRPMGWDDGMMVVAVIFSIAAEAANIRSLKYGWGRHHHFLNEYQLHQTAKWNFMGGLLYNFTIFFVKFSIILFLLRIVKLKRWVRTVLYLDLFLVFGSLAAAIVVQLVQCIPIAHNWNPAVSGHCLPPRTSTLVSYVSSAFTTITDFVCAILPFFILWDLQISRKSKISIWILLLFGLVPGACSMVKIICFKTVGTEDSSWSSIPLLEWGEAEVHFGIIAGSIPALRALVVCVATRVRGGSKLLRSTYESRNPYRYRVRNHDKYDFGTSAIPLHERPDADNQGGIVKTTEFEVRNAITPEAEVRAGDALEGGGQRDSRRK